MIGLFVGARGDLGRRLVKPTLDGASEVQHRGDGQFGPCRDYSLGGGVDVLVGVLGRAGNRLANSLDVSPVGSSAYGWFLYLWNMINAEG